MTKLARIAIPLTAAALLGVVAPSPAHATTVAFSISVDETDMSAVGYVYDSFGGTFTATMTAVGVATCGLASPQTVIAASDQRVGNPVYLRTPGTCRPYNAEVTYDLAWVGILGTSGHHTVVCLAHLGAVTCSLPGLEIAA